MIARACRYFGATPDYWEDALTMDRLLAQEDELSDTPPVDALVAAYMEAQGVWTRLPRDNPSSVSEETEEEDWNPDIPEFVP